ncbi:MAG: UDP-N-acetylmuramoyl-tripeptide--D-alanyl-D-alanine ligase [Thermodesulfobacteriota bacterium]
MTAQAATSSKPQGFGYGFSLLDDPPWNLAEVEAATGGRVRWQGGERLFRTVTTDSRGVQPGDLFLALRGERFDGHDFIGDALRLGAAGLIVERAPASALRVPLVEVADSLIALGNLARHRRRQMRDLRVIGITGSCGKTSVKELTGAILEQKMRIIKTRGNFNNLVGLPLSLLPVGRHHRAAILEMGMNHAGEIARLTEIADPDVACITNVHEAHVEAFGSVDGIVRAKGELFAGARSDAVLVFNGDDSRLARLARRYGQRRLAFGRGRNADVRATRISARGLAGTGFTLHIGADVTRLVIPGHGLHSVMNALAAAAIAHALGVDFADIAAGLAKGAPVAQRFQLVATTGGPRLINDAYNANPGSMAAAIDAALSLRGRGRLVLVLGDMFELGDRSETLHRELGQRAAASGADLLLATGEASRATVAAARATGMEAAHFPAKEALAADLLRRVAAGALGAEDSILVKGSRGMRMETIIEALVAGWGGA